MSQFMPPEVFAAEQMQSHPSLKLPKLGRAVRDSQARFYGRLYAAKYFKTDTPSLAAFIKHCLHMGWLNPSDVADLAIAPSPYHALIGLSRNAASYMTGRLALNDAIDISSVAKRVGGSPIDARAIQALAHAATQNGLVSNSALLSGLQSMNNINAQFPVWFCDHLNAQLRERVSRTLGINDHDQVIGDGVSFGLEGAGDGAGIFLFNADDVAAYHLYFPLGETNSQVMLRDTLCLMSDVLTEVGIHHYDAAMLFSGGGMVQEDSQWIADQLDGLPPTIDNIETVLKRLLIESHIENDGAESDLEPFADDLHALLSVDDLVDGVCDLMPSLYGTFSMGGILMVDQWLMLMSTLLQDDQWFDRSYLPPDLQHPIRRGGHESAAERHSRHQRVTQFFKESVDALATQQGNKIPATVKELQRIADWLIERAACGVNEQYLEDQDYQQEGIPFEMTYILVPNLSEVAPDDQPDNYCVPLSLGEKLSLEDLEEEGNNIGSAPRAALVSFSEGFESFDKIIDIAADYATLDMAMSRLSDARKSEKWYL